MGEIQPADDGLTDLIRGGHADACLEQAHRLLEAAEQAGDLAAQARLFGVIGIAHQYVGRSRESLFAIYQGIGILATLEDRQNLGWMYSLAAVDLARLGDPMESLKMLTRANETLRSVEDPMMAVRIWNNSAVAYHMFGQYAQAVDAVSHAIELAEPMPDRYLFCHARANLVLYRLLLAQQLMSTDEARATTMADEALALAADCEADALAHGWGHLSAMMYREVGPVLCATGRHDQARALLTRCLGVVRAIGRDREVCALTIRLAAVARLSGALLDAARYLTAAEDVAAVLADPELLIELHEERSLLLEQLGDYPEALRVYKVFHTLATRRQLDQSEAKAQVMSLHLARVAQEDPLTGVGNRRYFDERIADILAEPQLTLCLMFVDLDHFKQINDEFGHAVGDRVLVEVAAMLQRKLRPEDVICRYGGEEFLIAMPALEDAGAAQRIAERIRRAVAERSWQDVNPQLRVTCSIGVAMGRSGELEPLLAAADDAVYEAKRRGRNQVVSATVPPHGAPALPGQLTGQDRPSDRALDRAPDRAPDQPPGSVPGGGEPREVVRAVQPTRTVG